MGLSRDEIVDLIRRKCEEKEITFKDLSLAANKNQAYIFQFCTKGSPRVLPEDVRYAVAQKLDLDESLLSPVDRKTAATASVLSRDMLKLANTFVYEAQESLGVTLDPVAVADIVMDVLEELPSVEQLKEDGKVAARILVKNYSRRTQ